MAKIQQWNLHNEEVTTLEIGDISDSIYLLQEPYYDSKSKYRPGVRKVKNFHSHPRSRAAIYASALTSFSFVPMPQFTNEDIAVGSIEGGCLKYPIVIASIYLDIEDKQVILPLMAELIDFCSTRNMKLICGIDCNAHSPLWGSGDLNKRGEVLEEFIFQKGLFVHNIGNEPTWQARGLSSIIDITVSLNLGDELMGWGVTKTTLSDHHRLSFVLGTTQNTKVWSRNYSRANWSMFQEYISSNLKEIPKLWSEDIVESALNDLYDTVNNGLDFSCPKRRIKNRDSLLWWNHDCENAKRQFISMKRKMQREKNFTYEVIEKVKAARRKLKYIIRNSKLESFRELVRETDSVPAMSKLDKILDRKEASKLGFVTKNDGVCTTSTDETLRVMFTEHFPGSEPTTDLDVRSNTEGDPRPIDELEWVTDFRIKEAIKLFEPHKAAGPDGLRPIVLQNFPDTLITYLRHLYTACFQMGFTPSQWCHSLVIFLPKPGKKNYKALRSFRPISLAAFLFKTAERLITWRTAETALPLHPRQFAFQKNISTDHALSYSLDVIEKAYYTEKMVITIDLDIQGAFDNISTGAIIRAMEKKKVDNLIITWYSDYLQNRTCESTLGGNSVTTKLNRGCPQGGVASPVIAWCFPFDDFLEAFDASAAEQFGFADDGRIIIIGVDFQTMFSLAQWCLNTAQRWAGKAGVRFSPEKTTVMFINKGMFQPLAETQLKLYDKPLAWSTETKYLGITIDHKLTFKKHLENKIAAAKRKLMILGNVFKNSWGPTPRAAKWAYTGIVRPALTYGAIIWAGAAQKEEMRKALKKLDRLALLQIAPVRKSTPTAALQIIYDIMPLHIFIWEQALKTSARIGINPNWTPKIGKGHQHLLYEGLPEEVRRVESDNQTTSLIWEQNYEVIIGKGEDIQRREWACYTDGSKSGVRAGSGGVVIHKEQLFANAAYAVGTSTVFQAEVSGVLTAAGILLSNDISNSEIDILVDSQAALMSIRNPITNSKLVTKTKSALNKLGSNNDVKLRWIRAHKGYKYNEAADINANKGAKMSAHIGNTPCQNRRSIMAAIEEVTKKKWETDWEKYPDCRQSKYFMSDPAKMRAKLLLSKTRDEVGQMARFLTGHAFLRRQNAIVATGINPPPGDNSCRMCEHKVMAETPHHLITECECGNGE